MNLLDGKKTAEEMFIQLNTQINKAVKSGHRKPKLVAIWVGDHAASASYLKNKKKSCEKVGVLFELRQYPDTTTQEVLLKDLRDLNQDSSVDGIITQLPLPNHINEYEVISAIKTSKDVDGFTTENIGKMALGYDGLYPATPAGIVELLKAYQISTEGMHCVVVGRSNIVGMPISLLLSKNRNPGNCTVTLCHSKTKNLSDYTKSADLLIVAIGKPNYIGADDVKENAIVVDVGIHYMEDSSKKSGYRLVGDVDFERVAPKTSWITPVPGGVGPMTVAQLIKNTVKSYLRKLV